MTRLLLAVVVCGAVAVSCQTPTPSSETAQPVPASSTPSASVLVIVPPAASAAFVPAVFLRLRPDTVHVWSSAHGQYPPFDRTVSDTARATALLQLAAQLHVAPFRWCPADFGYTYTIEWYQGGRLVTEGSLQAHGCAELRLDSGPGLETTPEFWNELADLLGVPEQSLHPEPRF